MFRKCYFPYIAEEENEGCDQNMRDNVMGKLFANLQRIGRALMLPIAVLPAAALLLRFGAPDVLDIPFVTSTSQNN